jgi:sugar (pentulose or hexulose) kinase
MKHVAVIDIGKTNVKLALVDRVLQVEVAVVTCPNHVVNTGPYPYFDTDAIWAFLTAGLVKFHAAHGIDGIVVTTHGACAALLAADGNLAAPVMDYEHTGPDDCRADYDAIRPPFALTGSPSLPQGLNLGAQLFWQLNQDSSLADRVAHVVTWPQYWGFRLTGELACDVCSLGCHTDLWNPYMGGFSTLPEQLGLATKFAPPRKPGGHLGYLRPALQVALGLPKLPVLVGIHDSNASLLPHLLNRPAPFSVVSTGTWVVVMGIGAKASVLDPPRDTLMNVSALGDPVPSARFMGGREYEVIRAGQPAIATDDDAAHVLERGVMLFPAVVPGSGPFGQHRMCWSHLDRSPAETAVALGWYLAMMTAECLRIIGAQGPSIVEGPFAENAAYLAMLATATGREVIVSPSRTGTAIGAALLFSQAQHRQAEPVPNVMKADPRLSDYAAHWRAVVGSS